VIVTCERCSTQFRLDDKRVPERGVRVRCSRCKYAFRVEPLVSSGDERIQRAAARGLEPDTPEVTQDLLDEEEDWQFNDDRPAADEGEPGAGEVPAESDAGDLGSPLQVEAAGPGDADGFGADAASQPTGVLDGAAADAPLADSGLDLAGRSASGAPEAWAEPAASFDLSGQDTARSGLELAGPERRAVGLDPGAVGEAGPESPQQTERRGRAAGALNAAQDIESPDKWDFFASDSSDKPATPARVRLSATPIGVTASRSAPIPRDLVDEDAQPHARGLDKIVNTVGWVVVAAVFAAGLYGGFAPGARGSAAARGSQRVADLQVEKVGGRWIDNLVAGSRLFLTLLDAAGERLKLAPIPVGPPLPQALLRQADPADLQGAAGQALSPGPGASLRIEAVIPAPPAAASAFRFVTAEELAALNVAVPVPHAPPDAGDSSGASGETLPSELEIRPEEPGEAS
jgi:predicted Zn finger-like uncharacterized protein